VSSNQVAEVLGWLRFGEHVDLTEEVATQTPDGVGVDGLELQPLELKALNMQMLFPIKVRRKCFFHAGLSSQCCADTPS